jgi:putative SOS response-associated peptidase YedK
MCGRASLTKNEKELEDRFGSSFYSEDIERYNPVPNYNIAPGQFLPLITNSDPGHFNIFKWGLIPFWSKDSKSAYKLINSRAETLEQNSVFKSAFQRRRCLIPLDGFYEWKINGKSKIPYRIVKSDYSIFSAAGIWENWKTPEGNELFTFSIITVEANETVARLHNRMPAILFEDEERLWIDDNITISEAKSLLKPFPSELIFAYPVSQKVNNVRNNEPDLVTEISDDPLSQGKLF